MATLTRPRRGQVVGPELPAELDRRFDAFVFDWDGTAVPDRRADASGVRAAVERLCALGADVAVITGTHIGNVDPQLGARPAGPLRSSPSSTIRFAGASGATCPASTRTRPGP